MPVITHNMLSQFTNRQLNITDNNKSKSSEKLSSGYRINRASDDAAGLAISEKLRWQVRGLNRASLNISDGISICQVADGALNETHEILQRMRELSVQAANDTNSEEERNAIQQEIDLLTEEVDRVANDTSFNKEIFPLTKNGMPTSGNTDIDHIVLDAFWIQGRTSSKLEPYFYYHGKYAYFDIKPQLNVASNSLDLYLMDGTKICELKSVSSLFTVKNEYHLGYDFFSSINFAGSSDYFETNVSVVFGIGLPHWLIPPYRDTYTNDEINACLNEYKIMMGAPHMWMVSCQFNHEMQENDTNMHKLWIQTGAQSGQGMFLSLVDATAKGIEITDPALDVTSHDNASESMSRLSKAINKVSTYRSNFGAQQNRLEFAMNVDDNTAENSQTAESRIRDTDMASEMVTQFKHNILQQAGQSMLAQANQIPNGVLQLLQ